MLKINSKPVIAICDDDVYMRKQVELLLKRTGLYSIQGFSSGADLLEYLDDASVNLILLDVRLPDVDGIDLCASVHSKTNHEQVPVIFLSAESDVNTKVVAFNAGAVDFIQKPVNGQELKARLETHLKVQRLQEQLKESQSKYKALVHVLCHDLANYVGAIFNTSQMLQRADKTEDIRGSLPRIHKASSRAYRFLKTVHEVVAGEEDRLNINVAEHSALDLIEESASILSSKFEAKNIKLSVINSCFDVRLMVDRNWFVGSVLNNLLSNACKYSYPDGNVQIELNQTETGLSITLRDFGVGMLPARLAELSSATVLQSNPGTEGEKGSGMGIPLVRQWVTKLGGELQIDSVHESQSEDHGTTIKLSFPCV